MSNSFKSVGFVAVCVLLSTLPTAGFLQKKDNCEYEVKSVPARGGTYWSPGYDGTRKYEGYSDLKKNPPYKNGVFCKKLFKMPFSYGDHYNMEFKITDTNLDPPTSGKCGDSVTFYAGETMYGEVLARLCGRQTATFKTDSKTVLMVFITDDKKNSDQYGFCLYYRSIDKERDSDLYSSSTSSTSNVGIIAACVIPMLFVFCIMFLVVYKRCKYAERVRTNLAATGHTPQDLQVAMIQLVDQASRGPIVQGGRVQGQGGQQQLQQALLDQMDKNAQRGAGRVRHPAGDPSGYAHHPEGHYPPPGGYQSNNNVNANNNTAQNLNYPNHYNYSPVQVGGFNGQNAGAQIPQGAAPGRNLLPQGDDNQIGSSGRRSPRYEPSQNFAMAGRVSPCQDRARGESHAPLLDGRNGNQPDSTIGRRPHPSLTAPPPSYDDAVCGNYAV